VIGLFAAASGEGVATSGETVDLWLLAVGLLGGLALFLHGMERMTESLRMIAGDRMRDILRNFTENRLAGMFTGAGVTAIIQSSSLTTVLVVGFISSGLMTLEQSIGVIIGANIGTTVTAQIIAFDVSVVALAAIAVGFGITFFGKQEIRRTQGTVILGLGLVFFGMNVMGDAMSPLRSSATFIDLMARLENPIAGIGVGALFTALVQSSSATTGIVIVLAQQDLISLQTGIALVLGANVGTAITAVLAAIGKPRDAMRAAAAHTLFNVGGVLIWLPFIGILASVAGSTGGGTAREVANAHTLFNVANAAVAIAAVPLIARLVRFLVPSRSDADEELIETRYLDEALLRTPSLALDRARMELLRMAKRVDEMLREVLPAILTGTRWELLDIQKRDDEVDSLYGQIVAYLGQVGQRRLSDARSSELFGIMEATNDLETIGDVIETNLVALGISRIENNVEVSPATQAVLAELHQLVCEALESATYALTHRDHDSARRVIKMKSRVNAYETRARAHQAARLAADEPDRVPAYRLEIDVITNLKRVYYYAKRIARMAVPKGEPVDLGDD
jgi:phosphate:Na+ symporter